MSIEQFSAELAHFASLDVERRRAAIPDAISLKQRLDAAIATGDATLPRLMELKGRLDALTGPLVEDAAAQCQARVRELLTCLPRAADVAEVEQAEGILGLANQEFAWIKALRADFAGSPLMRRVEDQITDLARRIGSVRRYVEARADVQRLAARSASFEQALPDNAVMYAKDAAIAADAALNSGFDWCDPERDALRLLLAERQGAYDDLRRRHEMPVTRQSAGEVVHLIIDFKEWAGRDPTQLVTYFTSDEPTAPTGVIPVSKALKVAQEKLVLGVWRQKVDEYIKNAETRLTARQPREALAELRRWEELPGLRDDRVGLRFPDNYTLRLEEAERRIRAELEKREQAEAALLRARVELQTDVVAAYRSWTQASAADPTLPALPSLLADIQARAESEAGRVLAEVEAALAAEEWALCATRFTRLDALLQVSPALRETALAQIDRLKDTYSRVEPLLPGRPRLSFKDELALLQELQADLPERWESWPRLTGRLATLEARRNIQSMIEEAQPLCRADALPGQIEALYVEFERLAQDPPEGLSAQDERQLRQVTARLAAWLGFAHAREVITAAEAIPTLDPTEPTLETTFAPDLAEAREGLRAAESDVAARQACGQHNLAARLRRLEANDAPVRRLLEEAVAQLPTAGAEQARVLLSAVNQHLKRPNSSRAELLALRQEIQRRLSECLAAELQATLAQARPSRYTAVNLPALEAHQVEFDRLPAHLRPAPALLAALSAAMRIGQAHQLARAAAEGHVRWDEPRRAWESAAEAATGDPELSAYCRNQVRLCQREQLLEAARRAGSPEAAERVLAPALTDEAFRNNGQLLLLYGRYALLAAQGLLRAQPQEAELADATAYLERAREALGRAQAAIAVAAQGAAPSDRDLVNELRATAQATAMWERLARGKSELAHLLRAAGDYVRSDHCRDAATRYEALFAEFPANEVRNLLQTYWNYQRNDARSQLERRLKQAADQFDRVDALFAMSLLFPEDATLITRLVELVVEALRITKVDVAAVLYDASASRFLERYTRLHRAALPTDHDVTDLQLADVKRVATQVDTMSQVLALVRDHLGEQGGDLGSLDTEKRNLLDWTGQLQLLQSCRAQVISLAQYGLKDPAMFASAQYLLWLGSDPIQAPRIPATFRDAGHPTYRWLQNLVARSSQRRSEQEKHRKAIETALKYEQAETPDALPENPHPDEAAIVGQLRHLLNQPVRVYPLEHALALLNAMAKEEPDDACGLQDSLEYHNPDEPGRVCRSLPQIRAVVERKVEQLRVLRRWLAQFSFAPSPQRSECPGIVDWPRERARIALLRDANPEGLARAQTECRRVERGDERGMFGPVWSLERARTALDLDAMRAVLRSATGETALCRATEPLDRQRKDLLSDIERQIAECRAMAANITWRLSQYAAAWQEVKEAYNAFVDQKRFSLSSDQATRFRLAATQYALICPQHNEFQSLLRMAHSKGLHHEAYNPNWFRAGNGA